MSAQDADDVRVIVSAWRVTLDRCGMDLWQMNRPSHQRKLGEGPVNLEYLAQEALTALAALHIDGGTDDGS